MQIISPQQIPGLLQNDIMHTLYANPHTHKNDWSYRKIQGQKLDNISLSITIANLMIFHRFY